MTDLEKNGEMDFKGDELDDSPESDDEREEKGAEKPEKGVKKPFVFITLSLLAVVALGLSLLWLYSKRTGYGTGVTHLYELKQPVPAQNYSVSVTFYIAAQSKEKEDFIRLDVVFGFAGLNGKECFERNEALYRDLAYRFLKKQRPDKNAQSQWSSIVKGPLLEHIKEKKNPCSVKSLHLEALQRV